jgi:hypothetical protein
MVVAIFLAARWFVAADPKGLVRALRWVGVGVAGALAAFFAVTGRYPLAVPFAILALGLLRRKAGAMFAPGPTGTRTSGQSSEVQTETLRMSLDHDSGTVDGEILSGRYAGRRLGSLALPEVLILLDDCRKNDPPSIPLIEAFLDRVHGEAWRDRDDGADASSGRADGRMSRTEAFWILGLEEGADDEAVKEAYHRLMLRNHPDQGGSTYFASKLNEARDALLND